MALKEPIPQLNWGLVGDGKIGGRGSKVDERRSSAIKEGEMAEILLGRHGLGGGGSVPSRAG